MSAKNKKDCNKCRHRKMCKLKHNVKEIVEADICSDFKDSRGRKERI